MPFAVSPAAIAAAAAAELPRIFDDARDVLRDGEPQYLRDGLPDSIPGQIAQAAGRSACRIFGTGTVNLNAASTAKYERACRPYLDDIGTPRTPEIDRQFPGLQCEGIRYRWHYRIVSQAGVAGPRQDVTCGANRFGPVSLRRVDNPPNGVQWWMGSFNATGVFSESNIASSTERVTVELSPIGRCDGQVDGCGNPPPIVIPPRSNPDPTPPPFRFNPGPFIDVDVDVDVNVDGSITVNVGTGPITVNPFKNDGDDDVPGGGDPGGGDPGAPTPPPGDIGNPGTAIETDLGDEVEDEAPEGEILVGLKIDVLQSPPQARQFAPGVFRGACYIYMGVLNNLDQDFGGSMLKSGQFFFAEKDNLTHWLVSANNGYRFRVTPYYREVQG